MDRFYYEIVAANDAAHHAAAVRACIAADPILALAAEPWPGRNLPLQSDLYVLLVIASEGIAGEADLRAKIAHASGGGFPVIPVVEDLSKYDFRLAPLSEIEERNAEGLDNVERLVRTLLHHGGFQLFEGGGSVFISYARVDSSALADAIREEFLAVGIGQTVDVHAFPGGDVIQEDIADRIRSADLVVLVDSQGASRSRWVAEEMDIAQAAHVPVIAVTPAARGFHHAFLPLHVDWSPGTSAAASVVNQARRVLARKLAFRVRVARTLKRITSLRQWDLYTDGERWIVRAPKIRALRVACVDRAPAAEDMVALSSIVGTDRALLVAGTRPFQPDTDRAFRSLGGNAIRATPLPTMASKIPMHATKRPLLKKRVFLSAAMPSDPDDVDLARTTLTPFVVSLAQALVELGATLVFGGHPSITPVVHRAIAEIGGTKKGHVELHQAKAWQADRVSLSQAVREGPLFHKVHWHGSGTSLTDDVATMRDRMIVAGLDAGVFVGGKTTGFIGPKPGIMDEHERFAAACPDKTMFVVGLAGGAARRIPSDGLAVSEVLRATADPDLAVALIIAELLDL